jgi:hemolysin D
MTDASALVGAAAGSHNSGWRHHWRVLRESWALESERRKGRVTWRETDFLPAALEIVETPPNPLGRWIAWIIMAFFGAALVWSVVAQIDVVAIAQGKVITEGRNKLVQASDAGVVRAIHVRDGQHVKRGEAMLTLDPTASGADRAQAAAALQAADIDMERGRTLLAALQGRPLAFTPPAGTPDHIITTQRQLIASRLGELNARVATLQAQAAEARAMEGAARAEMSRLADTLPFLTQRVEARRGLAEKGYTSKLGQLELEQQRTDHERQITVQQQNAARARANAAGVIQQIAMARAEALRQVLSDLAKAEADSRQAREELTKADKRSRMQVVRAPADGTVQQLAVYSEGAVLKAADPILVVVPDDARLIVEAQVLNKDAGFVHAGQLVTVKLEAFPFTRWGTLTGTLIWVSRDAVADEKLGPVYTARISVVAPPRNIGIAISPGLTATVEIKTATRRVIDYLLSPLERRAREAGRER